MGRYLCMLLNGTTVRSPRSFEASNDGEAIRRSLNLPAQPSDCTGFALWNEDRKIFHYTRAIVDEQLV